MYPSGSQPAIGTSPRRPPAAAEFADSFMARFYSPFRDPFKSPNTKPQTLNFHSTARDIRDPVVRANASQSLDFTATGHSLQPEYSQSPRTLNQGSISFHGQSSPMSRSDGALNESDAFRQRRQPVQQGGAGASSGSNLTPRRINAPNSEPQKSGVVLPALSQSQLRASASMAAAAAAASSNESPMVHTARRQYEQIDWNSWDKSMDASQNTQQPGNVSTFTPRSMRTLLSPRASFFDPARNAILRFDGYFQEEVTTDPFCSNRIRRVRISYFVVDETTEIREVKETNSGMMQGLLLKRHKVLVNGRTPTPSDLNVGNEFEAYSRVYHICSCTDPTREYMERIGVRVPPNEDFPVDQFVAKRTELDEKRARRSRSVPFDDRFQQYLAHDREMLRYFGVWKLVNRVEGSRFQDIHRVVVQFYPADSTVEVLQEEFNPSLNRADGYRLLVRRQKIPRLPLAKDSSYGTSVGRSSSITGAGSSSPTKLSSLDASSLLGNGLTTDMSKSDYISPLDLRIGSHVNILGRMIQITHCDERTALALETQYGFSAEVGRGIPQPEPQQAYTMMSIDIKSPRKTPRVMPPYNGFGSEEDSEQNCISLMPRQPRRDWVKVVENEGKCLHARAKFTGPSADTDFNRERSFILSFYLTDDTLSVYETVTKSTGTAGMLIGRRRARNPLTGKFYVATDIREGNDIVVDKLNFGILEIDEFSRKYLRGDVQPLSTVRMNHLQNMLHEKLYEYRSDLLSAFRFMDKDNSGSITKIELCDVMRDYGVHLTREEVKLLMNLYDTNGDGIIDYQEFVNSFAPEGQGFHHGVQAKSPERKPGDRLPNSSRKPNPS